MPGTLTHAGLQGLGLGGARDGYLYVPANHVGTETLPLLVLLHGASGSSSNWFGSYGARAEAARMIVLAPDSRRHTWDITLGGTDDVAFIDSALASVFQKCAVHPDRIAIGGFSDGASYALTLGLSNGEFFHHIVAYSPGFLGGVDRQGAPDLFISHGVRDSVLPIDTASRRIVPELRKAGYAVEYREFDGGHQVPPTVADAAMAWLKAAYAW